MDSQVDALGDEALTRIRTAGAPAAGYSIPEQPGPEVSRSAGAVVLDPELIKARLAESARAASYLAEIFTDDDTATLAAVPSGDRVAAAAKERAAGLDAAHSALLGRLAARPSWTRGDFDQMATDLGLLPDGALEVLNEAAFEAVGEPVCEGSDPIEINSYAVKEMLPMTEPAPVAPLRLRPRDRDAIISSLRAGVVPQRGFAHIQVGRANEVTAFGHDLDRVADGGSMVRFVIGDYGAGKTFFLNLAASIAAEKKLVTAAADLTPDRRLHVDRRPVPRAVRRADAQSRDPLHARRRSASQRRGPVRHHRSVRLRAAAVSASAPSSPDRLQDLSQMVGGYDFAQVIGQYWAGYDSGNDQLMADAIRWLRGEFTTKTDARNALGVRTIIDDSSVYDMLKLMARFVRLAGFAGLRRVLRRDGQPVQAREHRRA